MTRRRHGAPPYSTQLRGVWRSRGYGLLLEIGRSGYIAYEQTRISCLPVFEGSLEELAEHYVDVEVSPRGQAFSARRAGGVTRLGFRRLRALPRIRHVQQRRSRLDPVLSFDVLWHTFAEQYTLFDLRGIDWEAAYRRHRPNVDKDTPARRLFEVCIDMLAPLRDGHVRLHAPCGSFDAGGNPPLYLRLARELNRAGDARDVPCYLAELAGAQREMIRDTYLGGGTQAGGRLLEWGRLGSDTGYLAIRAMAGLCGRLGRPREDFVAADAAMARVLADLGDCGAWVVDLRGNGGGYDGVALRLASWLIDRRRLAFHKSARRGTGFTGQQPVHVEPARQRYAGHLYLLTSGLTASAAEVFILALMRRPGLTLLGEATQGILSDALERRLPNGWLVTLSNEVYRAPDGELYEDRGIPPHVSLPYLAARDRQARRDPVLDHVLQRKV